MYGANPVFKKLNLEIHEEDRVGLVGRNGSGKTTLFQLLSGIEDPDEGEIHLQKGACIGYLSQMPDDAVDMAVNDVLEKPFADLRKTEREMNQAAVEMGNATGMDEKALDRLMEKFDRLQQAFEKNGGYEIEAKIRRVVHGLGMADMDLSRPFASLSGGEQTKAGLAAALLEEPDLLLLDEPTNHLDLAAIEWLETFLTQYKGAVMLISHDRYFLDRTATKIFDLEDGELAVYNGNYSRFVKEKEERLLEEFQKYKEQQKKIKKMKAAIKRLREWANQANPPNEKFYRRAKSMEKALARIEKLDRPILERKKMGLELEAGKRSGKDVARIEGVAKAYGERTLFSEVGMHVRFRERAAIIGENGSGKSTLLRLLLGSETPDSGDCILGAGVKLGYLAQSGLEGYENETVVDAFRDQAVMVEGKARHVLAGFLFYGPQVFQKVKDLSGGERMRLRLAQLMHQDINFLVLDEPTNHLDIDSREVLEDTLEAFQGTILAVSHDRYFLNKLFERTYWLEKETLTLYEGRYDWARKKRSEIDGH
ncbi:MAG TPA: ABC-F type ribosomal protection protein [Bacillales bacterium]|nr:ABC-F type ribosomal protection protein [Bacillales bacterium]